MKLKNGLKILLIQQPNTQTYTIQLRGLAGSNYENINEIGCAHMLEHILANNSKIEKILEVGGKIVGITSRDDVLYGIHILKKHLEIGFSYLSNIFVVPSINNPDLIPIKNLVVNEIERHRDSAEKAIGRLSYKDLYPNQRLGKLNTGTILDAKKITGTTLTRFYLKHYRPENFILTICGSFDENEILEKIKEYFELETSNYKYDYNLKLETNNSIQIRINNTMRLSQTYIKINFYGYKISDKKMYAAGLLSKILDILIKERIREKNGWAYKSSVDSYSSRNYGIFSFYFVTANPLEVVKEIKTLLKQKTLILDDKLIDKIKTQIETTITIDMEKTSPKATYYSELFLHDQTQTTLENPAEHIKNVTKQDLETILDEICNQNPKMTIMGNNNTPKEFERIWLN